MHKPVRIYQVESTNVCQCKCSYCPHDKMTREQGYIKIGTVEKIIKYMNSIGQKYVALHHMGEPLLHPVIGGIIWQFYKNGIETELSTNGALLKSKGMELLANKVSVVRIAVDYYYNTPGFLNNVAQFLEDAFSYPDTFVSIHTVNGNDLSMFEKYKNAGKVILENKQFDNWVGQVAGESKLDPANKCYFQEYQYVSILWDGTVVPCCIDYNGDYKLGHIDDIDKIENVPCKLCFSCNKLQFAKFGKWEE